MRLLKWPGRLLVFLLISGLIAVTAFLWIVNRSHQTGVHDLEGKTIKLFVMLCVVIVYFVAIHKLIITFQSPLIRAHSSPTLQDDDSDHLTQPAIIADFIKNRGKSRQTNKFDKSSDSFSRPFNVASDGINYYVVLLESPYKTGAKRGGGESRIVATTRKAVSRHARYSKSDNADAEDADDEGSCNSITEV